MCVCVRARGVCLFLGLSVSANLLVLDSRQIPVDRNKFTWKQSEYIGSIMNTAKNGSASNE